MGRGPPCLTLLYCKARHATLHLLAFFGVLTTNDPPFASEIKFLQARTWDDEKTTKTQIKQNPLHRSITNIVKDSCLTTVGKDGVGGALFDAMPGQI